MEQIRVCDDPREIRRKLADRNESAAKVLEMMEQTPSLRLPGQPVIDPFYFHAMAELGVTGNRIPVLLDKICGGDIEKMAKVIGAEKLNCVPPRTRAGNMSFGARIDAAGEGNPSWIHPDHTVRCFDKHQARLVAIGEDIRENFEVPETYRPDYLSAAPLSPADMMVAGPRLPAPQCEAVAAARRPAPAP